MIDEDPADPVPPAALLELMVEYLADEKLSDHEFQEKMEAREASGELGTSEKISDRYDIDAESLDIRANALTAILTARNELYRLEEGEPIWIEPALLDHAATTVIGLHDKLRWTS